tara:strand:+ start:175 stop:342 length:168 start_codon:yes stop_codon:yes gene_type:complete
MNEEIQSLLQVNLELGKTITKLKSKLKIALEGLKAIDEIVETNIAQKTIDEIEKL